MIKHGPVDVVVLAFGEPHFDGRILSELERQAASGTIRVLDALVLLKDESGKCWRMAHDDLPPDEAAALGFIETGTRGLLNSDDADTLCEGMVPGSAILALAIEHTWAVDLVNALDAQGVELALNFRVPAPIVDEAFASLAINS
jgi:hypothetical protein